MAHQPHHRSHRYQTLSRRIRTLAKATPLAVCWRDGLTLAQHQQANPTCKHTWHAGHTIKGSTTWQPWYRVTAIPPAGDWLAPEVSSCNIAAENHHRQHANPHTESW